jgi:streptogramin lyase
MATQSWIRTRFTRKPRTARQDRARVRPRLEELESRLAPAFLLGTAALVEGPATGNVYIADSNNNAIKEGVRATGLVNTVWSAGLSNPTSVAMDSAGNVYVADINNLAVKEWNATTHQVSTLVASGLNQPGSVAVDRAGNVYFADAGNNAIKEWSAATAQVSTLVASGLNGPFGVAVDGAGNVYIAATGSGWIEEWSATRHQVTLAVHLTHPYGVAVDGASDLYVADNGNVEIDAVPRVFVPVAPVTVEPDAGMAALLPVLPTSQSLTGVFAPYSDQPWLTVGNSANGVVTYSFTQNTGPAQTANLYVLGAHIPVQQNPDAPTITQLSVPTTGNEGSPVTLSAAATLPAGSTATLTYTWTITVPPGAGSNITLTGATASFVPPDDGSYRVSLTVSASDGGSTTLPGAGLISSYRGEGNALEVTGAHNGTAAGGVTYVAGNVGQAFSFDGSTGYVQLPNNFLPYPTTGTTMTPGTFETWFRTTAGGVILVQVGLSGG